MSDPFIVFLRPHNGIVLCDGVVSPEKLSANPRYFILRGRFNPEIRALTMPFPEGSTQDAVGDAVDALSDEERYSLYKKAVNLG